MVSNLLKLSASTANYKEHIYMSNIRNKRIDFDLNMTTGQHVPVFYLQCVQLICFLNSASMKEKIMDKNENRCGTPHNNISSSSSTSLFPSFPSPSVLSWLSLLLSSIPLEMSEDFLRTLVTRHLLDMIDGGHHSHFLKAHKLKRMELAYFPFLASTVMVSQLVRSSSSSNNFSSRSIERENQSANSDNAKFKKKRLFSNFWIAANRASDTLRAKDRTPKDVIDICLEDLQVLFLATDLGTSDDEKARKRTGTGTGAGAGTGTGTGAGTGTVTGTGTGTGTGTRTPQRAADPLLHVFDNKWLETLLVGRDGDINNLISDSMDTDSLYLRGDRVEDQTERKGLNLFYLQLKLIGIMGWGLLPCFCASSVRRCDRSTHIHRAHEGNINPSNKKGDGSEAYNNLYNSSASVASENPFFDVGMGAAAIKDILQSILDCTDAISEEEGLNLGLCSSSNGGDKVLVENQKKLPVKSIPIHFCVTLLASCLTTTSSVGVRISRCSTTSTLDNDFGILSIKPIMIKLAAGVGPIALSFLLKILERHIKEELEVPGLCVESLRQDPLLSTSIPCPSLVSSMGADQSWKEPGFDLRIYLACLHGKYVFAPWYVRVCIVCTCLNVLHE